MTIDFDPKISYLNYINQNQVEITPTASARLTRLLDNCQWEQPQTALDWNNLAVAALVAAESCDNSLTHGLYAEIAFDAVQAGSELNQHPLCAAHLALLNCMLGNYSDAAQIAFSAFINNLQPSYTEAEIEPGIVYIPPLTRTHITNGRSEQLQRILNTDNGYIQAMLMLTEVLCRTQITLDNRTGIRLLHLMNQLMPDLIFPNIRLGIYSIGDRALEGLVYLHRAGELALDYPTILQSLYLAYRDLEQPEVASYWQQIGLDYGSQRLAKIPWQWTQLPIDSHWTYIPFDTDISLAVPASLQSPTTRCLLAEGDWFERELEFWRQYIQPGMNVIDIGANVGAYTFSAARRVGKNGIVYAIEPFSGSIDCLQETCQVNQIDNVKIFKNAVSDRDRLSKLVLQSSSELNYLAIENEVIDSTTEIEEVSCLTIDTFIQQQSISKINVIKISTEGNELSILIGGEQTIVKFSPTIIYNSYTSKGINLAAAEYLLDRGYELFRYQPYLQQLIPLVNESDFTEVIKAIAIKRGGSGEGGAGRI
ncbi:FkbM family methyltransferase [Chamaesiphon sp. VAR_48_metabat_135_sub]|uniref:FkbM family methyltransferase n=1 Tax=Chamaesiphon sp. VAR_48_metabat_135_sub TaxID=2964699 RepID=UPI00286AF554|nr:FkbM family methyltransferase [Chamaesiphon sp. VAR_48_metabat_135_sub]